MASPTTQQTAPNVIEQKESLLDQIAAETARLGMRYMPTLTVKQFTEREAMLKELKEMLVEGTDYGTIPGTPKPTLYQAGAQKICAFFGYAPIYVFDVVIEDWDGSQHAGEPLFYYRMVCTLTKDGKPVGSGPGSCNSWESKYRFRWVTEDQIPDRWSGDGVAPLPTRDGTISEPKFAVDKAETTGPYGKPAEYWQRFRDAIAAGEAKTGSRQKKGGGEMATWEIGGKVYRIPNEGFPDIINTVQKIAAKRAYVGACLSATGASQYFTQDLDDMAPEAIGTRDNPAPASSLQHKPAPAKDENPALLEYLKRAAESKTERQSIFKEMYGALVELFGETLAQEQFMEATKNNATPEHVVRHLFKILSRPSDPKADYLPADLGFEKPKEVKS